MSEDDSINKKNNRGSDQPPSFKENSSSLSDKPLPKAPISQWKKAMPSDKARADNPRPLSNKPLPKAPSRPAPDKPLPPIPDVPSILNQDYSAQRLTVKEKVFDKLDKTLNTVVDKVEKKMNGQDVKTIAGNTAAKVTNKIVGKAIDGVDAVTGKISPELKNMASNIGAKLKQAMNSKAADLTKSVGKGIVAGAKQAKSDRGR